jgi:lipopolysaccharide transport system ATP-binding protein
MSNEVVIRARNLGKSYTIGHQHETERYVALRDVLTRSVKSFARSAANALRGKAIVHGDTIEEFWALRKLDFEVKRGEILGIIGRNGAGKSTLLKVLSRITEPTEGSVEIRGRVASLLEVGTGFHPELTGRENIYLNGAILGMTRSEIRRKFDDIVSFAEVEKFLDTPVKRYSSGMYVRLAFAVAAHLEPEILVVDEVLAVGDAEFQRKCLDKMSEVAGGGRTILFVSHSMDAIRRVCGSGMLLSAGTLAMRGSVDECISNYFSRLTQQRQDHTIYFSGKSRAKPHLVRIEMLDKGGGPLARPKTWDYVKFRIHFFSPRKIPNASLELFISSAGGAMLTRCSTSPDSGDYPVSVDVGENFVDCEFPNLLLSAGSYIVGAGFAIPNVEWLDGSQYEATIDVDVRDIFNSGRAPAAERYLVPMPHTWLVPGNKGVARTRTEVGS